MGHTGMMLLGYAMTPKVNHGTGPQVSALLAAFVFAEAAGRRSRPEFT